MKILIATTNQGKFEEIKQEFNDLSFEFLSLKDVKLDKKEIDEPYKTTWENALHKAKYFAKKTKLLTLAEDTLFSVKALNGNPGIHAKRYGRNPKERVEKLLKEMKNIPKNKRQAYFETHACIYNPRDDNCNIFFGKVNGLITNKPTTKNFNSLQYDAIFYYPPIKKTFAEIPIKEKNTFSQRGQVLNQIKRFLLKQYSFKQYLVVGGIIVKNKRMLLQKRRDSRPEFNNKWEFVGGGIDNGESVEEALKREVKEESGYNVEPIEILPEIINKVEKKYGYQVFLLLYICKIKSGKLKANDAECAGHSWFTLEESLKLDFLPANKKVIKENIKILKKYID